MSRDRAHAQTGIGSRLARDRVLLLMLAIPILYIFLFKYGPMVGLVIAFQDYNVVRGIFGSRITGFRHFERFLTDDMFWRALRNTLLLNLYNLAAGFPVPILLALLMNEVKHASYRKFVQTVSYLPYFLSTVVVCGMVVNFLASDGLINQVVEAFGGKRAPFLILPQWFRTIYVVSDIWAHAGWGSIIYLAALAGVDPQLYEAAIMDGASKLRRTIHISLPSIAPVISITFLLNLGRLLSVGFEKVLLLYNGNTYETADVISTLIYRRGLVGSDFSYGAAVGLFQAVIAFTLIILCNKIADAIGQTSLW